MAQVLTHDVHAFRCFGTGDDQGNHALVVRGSSASIDERQQFASESGKACVFVDGADDPAAEFILDFYYPHARSPLCIHAAVAAAALLAGERPVTVQTAVGSQQMQLRRTGNTFAVTLQRQEAPNVEVDNAQLRELLGDPVLGFAAPAQVTSVGSPKLLVRVNDAGTLHRLQPNLGAIAAWSREHGVNGIYVYWVCSEGELEGRNFNHVDPRAEDNATGVAAGALTVLFNRPLRVCQGSALGNPCLMETHIDGDTVSVGGRVQHQQAA